MCVCICVYAAGTHMFDFRFLMVFQLFWVYARGLHRTAGNHRHRRVSKTRLIHAGLHNTWSTLVLRDLQSGKLRPPGINDENVLDAKAWQCSTEVLDCMVIGLVLAEPDMMPTMLDVLAERDRCLKDYYDIVWREDGDLLKFRVVEAIPLQQPQRVWLEKSVRKEPRSMIFRMSPVSAGSCMDCPPFLKERTTLRSQIF